MESELDIYVRVVHYHQNLIPLENKKLQRKFSYSQVANFPENVLFDYYLIIKNKIRKEWVNVVYDCQDLIPVEIKGYDHEFSFDQVSYFDEKKLEKYYLIIMRKLGKMPLTLEPLSAFERSRYVQQSITPEVSSKSDIDEIINGEIYAGEAKDSELLGPREPNSITEIVKEAEELWEKIHRNDLFDVPLLSSVNEIQRDGNDIAYPNVPIAEDENDYDDFLGPRGPKGNQEDEEYSYQKSIHR